MESIKVSVEGGSRWVDIEELHDFQGDLKELSTENYTRLKNLILKHGFSFVIHVWENEGYLFIIDGHQRVRTLGQMRIEGYQVPQIPVAVIKAVTFKDAKNLVKAGASSFGKLTEEGLYQFDAEAGLDWRDTVTEFNFAEIDSTHYVENFFGKDIRDLDQNDPPVGESNKNNEKELKVEERKTEERKPNRFACPHCAQPFELNNLVEYEEKTDKQEEPPDVGSERSET